MCPGCHLKSQLDEDAKTPGSSVQLISVGTPEYARVLDRQREEHMARMAERMERLRREAEGREAPEPGVGVL